jgi:hypothetical protein
MCMSVFYLDGHEAGLCCYLVIHVENLLRLYRYFTSICDYLPTLPRSLFIMAGFPVKIKLRAHKIGALHKGPMNVIFKFSKMFLMFLLISVICEYNFPN